MRKQYVVRGYEPESSWPYWLVIAAALGIATMLSLGCYATTGPVPSCASDPTQSWCLPAPFAKSPDGGTDK